MVVIFENLVGRDRLGSYGSGIRLQHEILVVLSKLDTDLIRHPCNALHARDRRKTRIFSVFCFRHHNFDHIDLSRLSPSGYCPHGLYVVLMISDTSQLVSNITFTHIKSPGIFKMITPIPDENQDDKMSIFSNICLLCQNTTRNTQVFRNLLVFWVWNMLNRTLMVREPGFYSGW